MSEPSTREPHATAPIVIVGSGHAGYSTAAALRQATDRELVLFTADEGHNYYKPQLSNALARGHEPEALIRERAPAVAERLALQLHAHCRVLEIDRQARVLHTERGIQRYHRLVLAVGAEPIRLPLAGDGAPDVLSVNDLADYGRFRARLAGARRVAIIGDGLIGCEFANDVAASGHEVTVIGLGAWPMDRLLPEAAGRRVQSALAGLGVQWHLQRTVERITHGDIGYRLELSDGGTLPADVVLSAVGLRPRTALAVDSGLAVGTGIQVDDRLCTSDPAIHAVGDCIELDGLLYPYIAPINHAVTALVPAVLGESARAVYPPMPVTVKTPAHRVVALAPPASAEGRWQVDEEEGGVRALFTDRQDRLAGFALTGALIRERMQWTGRYGSEHAIGRVDTG